MQSSSSWYRTEVKGLDTEEFRKLYIRLVESYHIDPKVAETLLRRIIKILKEYTDLRDDKK